MTARTLTLTDPTRPRWDGPGERPLHATVWTPAGSGPYPTVLLSHGTGGAAADLAWLAEALTDAGILVAGVDHHGNTRTAPYLPEGFAFVWERPRDLSRLLHHLVAAGKADPERVAAAGFSLGGYTTLALLGAQLDAAVALHVLGGAVPLPRLPEFPDLVARLAQRHSDGDLAARVAGGAGSLRDDRVRAGYAIAPSIGELVDPASLAVATAPVRLAWGEDDDNAVPDRNARRYLAGIRHATGLPLGAGVGHYEFLASAPDPLGARRRVAADAVAFLSDALAGLHRR